MSTGEPPRKAPTIFDVATRAGVSHQTVSRVINGDPTVREAYRVRVSDAVRELGYRPRAAARALAGGRSRAFGLVTAGDLLFGPSSTSVAFERAARAAGYHVSLATLPDDPGPLALGEALSAMVAQDVAAIVLIAADNRVLSALGSMSVPVPVVVANAMQRDAERLEHAPSAVAVAIDQAAGAMRAMAHLAERGRRRIVHITGSSLSQEAEVRRAVYERSMLERGLRPMVVEGDWSPACGFEIGAVLAGEDVDAVFCGNDQTALGVLHAFADAGVRVPEDVAVVGFDDIPEAAHFSPPLTTVRQDFAVLGSRVLDAALALVEGGLPDETLIEPRLVVRRSA